MKFLLFYLCFRIRFSVFFNNLHFCNKVIDRILLCLNFCFKIIVFKGDESKIINRYDNEFFDRFDYVEIHQSLLLGEIATNIPFCNRNCAPRNIFQYAQGRQGMGIYCTVYRSRTDISFILYNPEVPVVNSRTAKYTYNDVLPPGSNAVVAIACYSGLLISPCRNKSYGKSTLYWATLSNCGEIL